MCNSSVVAPGVLSGCGLKQEDESVDKWTRGCEQEVMSEATQEADKPTAILSPIKESEVGVILC